MKPITYEEREDKKILGHMDILKMNIREGATKED